MSPARPGLLCRRAGEVRLAFMLLTRLPMGEMAIAPPMPACVWAYPLVGAVVGGLVGVVFALALWAGLPPGAAALLAIGFGILLTGGLHEDGLADLADGFGGGRTKDQKLDIMRDSRIGSFGVLALVLVLGLRVELLASLPAGGIVLRLAGLGAMSRSLLPVVMLALPAARAEGFGHAAGRRIAAGPVVVGLVLATVILALGAGTLCGHLILLAAVAAVAALVAYLARRQIGGFTGDVLGAVQILCETAGLCVLSSRLLV